MKKQFGFAASAAMAGIINGIFGGSGGIILVPSLRFCSGLHGTQLFTASLSIMLPVSFCSLLFSSNGQPLPWAAASPYMIGASIGGLAAGLWGEKIPVIWLHRFLGGIILWGGIQYLC